MIVYWPTRSIKGNGHRTLAIAPLAEKEGRDSSVSEFSDNDGNPVTLRAEFYDGQATVSDEFGRYLIATKRAVARRPIITID